MTLRTFIIFGFFMVLSCKPEERTNSKHGKILHQLDSLLATHEYFLFRTYLEKYKTSLPEKEKTIYSAFADNAFNHVAASNQTIETLLANHVGISDSVIAKLLFIQRDNFIKLYQYRKAFETGEILLSKYATHIDTLQAKHIRNLNILYRAIADVPPQQVELKKEEIIKWQRDKVGLMNVSVQTTDAKYDFVFDTRASISTITTTYANKLKLRVLDMPYEESSGITGNTFKTYPAIADSVYVGGLLLRNVIFQVVPDDILAFPSINYQINGIIGFPVITQWKEVHIHENGTIAIPLKVTKSPLHNLAFDESTTVINLKTDVDTLSFHFDSGATSTMLYYNFLKRFEQDVTSKARKETSELGGAGGIKKSETYVYPVFAIYAGGKRNELTDIQVLNAPVYPGQKFYGNIGQDLLKNYKETILNFEDMYFDLKE
jgi:predicted aspartyl protease